MFHTKNIVIGVVAPIKNDTVEIANPIKKNTFLKAIESS